MSKQPWMKFYPSDWRADPAVKSCGLAARGLWIEMLAIMHEAEPRGSLVVNRKAVTPGQLASLVGGSESFITELLSELRRAGVFSTRRNGVIFSRRMERDEIDASKMRDNGKKGGNPSLCNKRKKEGLDNPEVKAQKPEARYQSPEREDSIGASAPSEPAPPDRFEEFWQAYPKREGANPKKPAQGKFKALVAKGGDPEAMIAAARRLAKQHPTPTPFCPQAVTWLGQERFADDDGKPPPPLADDARWRKRLDLARRSREWFPDDWGPRPGEPGCLVPVALRAEGDGIGWVVKSASAV